MAKSLKIYDKDNNTISFNKDENNNIIVTQNSLGLKKGDVIKIKNKELKKGVEMIINDIIRKNKKLHINKKPANFKFNINKIEFNGEDYDKIIIN